MGKITFLNRDSKVITEFKPMFAEMRMNNLVAQLSANMALPSIRLENHIVVLDNLDMTARYVDRLCKYPGRNTRQRARNYFDLMHKGNIIQFPTK